MKFQNISTNLILLVWDKRKIVFEFGDHWPSCWVIDWRSTNNTKDSDGRPAKKFLKELMIVSIESTIMIPDFWMWLLKDMGINLIFLDVNNYSLMELIENLRSPEQYLAYFVCIIVLLCIALFNASKFIFRKILKMGDREMKW